MSWAPELSLAQLAEGGLLSDGDWVESKDQDRTGSVRLTQLADVGVAAFRDRSDRWMRVDQAEALRCTYLKPGDVLIARMPDPIGRACLVPPSIGPAVTAVDVAILRIHRPDVDPRYAMWAINAPAFRNRVSDLQSGTTRKRISRKNLATLTIPVPAIDEQRRIVDILEEHLSRLDMADSYLEDGRRRLATLERSALAELHDGPVETLESLAWDSGYGTSEKCVVDGPGVAVVRIPNLVDGRIDLADQKRVADSSAGVSGAMLAPGDLLIVRTNGSVNLIGRSAVAQEGIEAAFASYLIRYRLRPDVVRPAWVQAMLNAPQSRLKIEKLAASSAGQYNLSLAKLNPLELPVPSLDDQDAGLARLHQSREALGRVRAAVKATSIQQGALRRSLLAAAFSGRLTGAAFDPSAVEETVRADAKVTTDQRIETPCSTT